MWLLMMPALLGHDCFASQCRLKAYHYPALLFSLSQSWRKLDVMDMKKGCGMRVTIVTRPCVVGATSGGGKVFSPWDYKEDTGPTLPVPLYHDSYTWLKMIASFQNLILISQGQLIAASHYTLLRRKICC